MARPDKLKGSIVSHLKSQSIRSSPKAHGSYTDYESEIVAQHGRAFAKIRIAHCDDELFRFGIGVQYCYGGFGFPVCVNDSGFTTYREARLTALSRLSVRWPKAFPSDPIQAHEELKAMRDQLDQLNNQPTLF